MTQHTNLKSGPWNTTFGRGVNDIRAADTPKKKVKVLLGLEKAIKFDVFVYENHDAEVDGKKSLLTLWEIFLDELSTIGSSEAKIGSPSKVEREKSGVLSQTQLFKHAFDCIPFLTRRYEFDLIHYFRPAEIGLYVMPSHLSLDETKIVLKTYKSMLTRTLKLCFHQLAEGTLEKIGNDPMLTGDIHVFCMRMLALCFFRQPLLCGPLMQTVTQCSHMGEATDEVSPGMAPGRPKPDWLIAVDKDLNAFMAGVEKTNRVSHTEGQKMASSFLTANPSFFEWTCPKIFDDVTILTQETSILSQAHSVLSVRFVERGMFFGFVFTWLHHITRLAHGCLMWNCIPGYFVIVLAFINRILQNCALLNDQKVLDCLQIISKNKQLSPALGYLSRVLLHSTNMFNKTHFNSSFDLLDQWMSAADGAVTDYYSAISEEATTMSTRIPDSFCSESFFAAIKLALTYDHFQVLLKTLTLLYMHLGRFYGGMRRKLLDMLFDPELFFSLLLHWHPEVRQVFCCVLVYRLQRAGLPPLDLRTSESSEGMPATRRSSMSCMSSSLLSSLSLAEDTRALAGFASDDEEENRPPSSPRAQPRREAEEEKNMFTKSVVAVTPAPGTVLANTRRPAKFDPDGEIGTGVRMSASRRPRISETSDDSGSRGSASRRSLRSEDEIKLPSSPRAEGEAKPAGRMVKLRRSLSSFFKAGEGVDILDLDALAIGLPKPTDRRHLLDPADPAFESCQLVYTLLDEFEQETDALYAEHLRDRLELLHSEVSRSTGAIQGGALIYAPKAIVKLEQISQSYRRLQQVFDNKLDGDFRLKFLLSHKRTSSNEISSPVSLAASSTSSSASCRNYSPSSSPSSCSPLDLGSFERVPSSPLISSILTEESPAFGPNSATTNATTPSAPPTPITTTAPTTATATTSTSAVPSSSALASPRLSAPPPPLRPRGCSSSTRSGSRNQQGVRGAGAPIRGQIFIPTLYFQISEPKM